MWQNQFVVLDKIGKTLLVAISNVISAEIFERRERVSGSQIFVYVSTWSQVQMALDKNVPLNGSAQAKPAAAKPAVPKAVAAVTPMSPPPGAQTAVRPGTQIQP